jgi:hypothetical protein
MEKISLCRPQAAASGLLNSILPTGQARPGWLQGACGFSTPLRHNSLAPEGGSPAASGTWNQGNPFRIAT